MDLLKKLVESSMFKGAMAAALAGALAAAGASILSPLNVDWHALLGAASGGALAGVLAYFKAPPQKPWNGEDRRDAQP